ncbi:heparan-alpha-glucosaminide N-acetyltransferase domain-containing protein [Microbacterium sp. P5_E9]
MSDGAPSRSPEGGAPPSPGGPPSRRAAAWQRLNGPTRIAGIDLARGFAIIGMFTAHLIARPALRADPATWIAIVDGRSSILFATLAGVSIGLVTGGAKVLDAPALRVMRQRLAVRGCLLWILGVALIATGVPVFVILPAYGILFLLAVPFTGLGARPLLIGAALTAVVTPFVQVWLDATPYWQTLAGDAISRAIGWHYPFPVWIAFLLAGMGVARAGIRRLQVQLRMLAAGAALMLVGYGLHVVTGASEAAEAQTFWGAVWTARPHSSGVLEVIGTGGFAVAAIAVCLLLCRTFLVWLSLPLRALGGMPLTAYTAQLLSWAVWATAALGGTGDLSAFRALMPLWPLTLGILIGCTAWALLVGRGPLESATDRISRLVVPGS